MGASRKKWNLLQRSGIRFTLRVCSPGSSIIQSDLDPLDLSYRKCDLTDVWMLVCLSLLSVRDLPYSLSLRKLGEKHELQASPSSRVLLSAHNMLEKPFSFIGKCINRKCVSGI